MNNEEKILSVLEAVVERLDKVDSRIDSMESAQVQTNERLGRLEAGQAQTNERLGRLETGQKNIRKDIKELQFMVHKGVMSEIERLDRRIDKVEKQLETR